MSDFYNKYPYTDFHELNLDWVIERVKKLTEDWLTTQEAWNDTEEQWQQLYDYVHDYFDNLDVQDEINNKINQMILDGSFDALITPIIHDEVYNYVPTLVTSWLNQNVDPVGSAVVVDKSLTISGAAADAQLTGSHIIQDINLLTDVAQKVVRLNLINKDNMVHNEYYANSGGQAVVFSSPSAASYRIISPLRLIAGVTYNFAYLYDTFCFICTKETKTIITNITTSTYTPANDVDLYITLHDTNYNDSDIWPDFSDGIINTDLSLTKRNMPADAYMIGAALHDVVFDLLDDPVNTGASYDTGITYDFSQPEYVTVYNKSMSNGYFDVSIYQDSTLRQTFSQLAPAGGSTTFTLFDANTSGVHGWMGANQYFSNYTWHIYIQNRNNVAATMDIYHITSESPVHPEYPYSNCILVDSAAVSGSGAFNDISDAVAYAKYKYDVDNEDVTVFLKKGTYNLQYVASRPAVIDKRANRISLIGEDRDETVIVLNNTPARNNKMIEHGGPSIIANMTWKNLLTDDGSTYDYTHNAYCIHNDYTFSTNDKYRTIVKNCVLYSEVFAPIGAGLHDHQEQVYEDCDITFDSQDLTPGGYNQWAPIYVHPPASAAESDCSLTIDACNCIALSGTKAIALPFGPSGAGILTYANIPTTIRHTIGYTTGGTITDVDNRYDIQPGSELNNVSAWDYSNYH